MKILVVCQHYWPENFRITDICEGLVEKGNSVDVLCGLPNYPDGEYPDGYSYFSPRRQTHGGVEIYRCGEIRRKGNTSLKIFLNYVSYPIFACFNLFRLIGHKYDAVFCYQLSPVLMMIPAILYAKTHSLPFTCYVLDMWPENLYSVLPIKNKFLQKIAKGVSHYLYKRADKIIVMSDEMKRKFACITPKAEIAVIPQYCEDFYADNAAAQNIDGINGKFKIMFTGNFSPAQDLNLLVKCAVQMKNAQIKNIIFILVGDGMSKQAIIELIKSENVGEYFVILPKCPPTRIPSLCASADVLFAALAKSEDLGMTVPAKIASYMATAKPILACLSGEGNKAVQLAKCGLVCESGDAAALYENILRFSQMTPELLNEMGSNSKIFYNANYTRALNLEKIEKFIILKPR